MEITMPYLRGCSTTTRLGIIWNVRHAFLIVAVFLSLAATGCVTSKQYRFADAGAIAPKALGLHTEVAQLELAVNSVIVPHGLGSWKEDAVWNEFLVSVVNRGGRTITLESALLTDERDQTQTPGTDPWQ